VREPAVETLEPILRPGRSEDHAYVVETWLQCDKRSLAARDEGPGYMRQAKVRIRAILARPDVSMVVACDEGEPDAIFGWAVTSSRETHQRSPMTGIIHTPVIYYIYVRSGLRRMGNAKLLVGGLSEARCIFTHRPIRGVPVPPLWSYDRTPNYEATR
jgi:hypothetical protein